MRYLAFILLLGLGVNLTAQEAPEKYWIAFTDKANSPYSIDKPLEFLSQRALDRRMRYGIPVIKNDLPVNPAYVQQVLALGDIRLLNRSRWMNAVTIQSTDTAALEAINGLPFVKTGPAFRSFKRSATQTAAKFEQAGDGTEEAAKTNDILNEFEYGGGINQVDMLHTEHLHNLGYSGEGMVIAVIDAGFVASDTLPEFARMWDENRLLGWYDFVDVDDTIFDKGGSHGTSVLSAMAAWLPGELIGTAPDASYWLLRSEDSKSEFIIEEANWLSAAEFADSAGVDVINASLGYSTFNAPYQNHTYNDLDGNTTRVTRAADLAASKGILVVSSAGNSGEGDWRYIIAPADADSNLTVGAVDYRLQPVGFTSRGPSADGRVKPNVAAKGSLVRVSTRGGLDALGGTSFASPLIAGSAACLWQAFPEFNNMEIIDIIERCASQYFQPDTLVGHGVPDFRHAFDLLFDFQRYDTDRFFAYPNPFSDQITLDYFSRSDQTIDVEMFDLHGRILYNQSVNTIKGHNSLPLFPAVFSPGVYYLRLKADGAEVVQPVVRF